MKILPLLLFAVSISHLTIAQEWPQAAGPNGNFIVAGKGPESFSVAKGEHVLWRSPLPNTGQGTVVISGDRAFVTSHETIDRDTETGSLILGLCVDANTGKELWRREIPGTRVTDLSSLFSDNTAASPIASDNAVCFVNVGGSVKCFDFDGKETWSHTWTPFGRHHARQHEPILMGDQLILMHVPCNDLPASVTTKAGAKPLGRGRDVWTYLQAYDFATGKRTWIGESATSVHSTSIIGKFSADRSAILTGRGGGHQPPEEPYGVSLLNASDGSQIWDLEIEDYPAAQNACWNEDVACVFVGKEHRTIDIHQGRPLESVSLVNNVTVCRLENGEYVTRQRQKLSNLRKAITNQSNILVGNYHYFLAHDDFLIGRANICTNKVEYLQVPVQVVREANKPVEVHWHDALRNDMKNADGFIASQDKRNAGSGWGHVSAASPIVVGDNLYMPTMIGMVYVLRWDAKTLDENALLSISDLGPATQTWSLSSLSFSNGKIYARTLKELICIGTK